MNTSFLELFAKKGTLVAKDVTPFQTFSGNGMTFHLEAYDWNSVPFVPLYSVKDYTWLKG